MVYFYLKMRKIRVVLYREKGVYTFSWNPF